MPRKMVYLSGMMDGVSFEDGNNWRKFAVAYLKDHNWDAYNPYDDQPPTEKKTSNEVFHKDIYYLDKCDVILANLNLPEKIDNKNVPFFTIGEMFLGHRARKPVIAYTNCLKGRAGYEQIVTKSLEDLAQCLEYIVEHF